MVDMSIIVPVYNCDRYISKCIESLQKQGNLIEIVLVNDASTDMSLATIYKYAANDSRIIVVNNECNMGAALARNKGLNVAKGRYVMFVDSDDFIEIGMVDILVKSMDKYMADMSYLRIEAFSDEGEIGATQKSIQGRYNGVYTGEKILQEFVKHSEFFLYLCSVCYRRQFIEDHKLNFQKIRVGEGGDFIIRALLNANRVIVNQECLYYYRIHRESITHSKGFKQELIYGQLMQYFSVLKIYQSKVESECCKVMLDYFYQKVIGGIQGNSIEENQKICDKLPNKFEKSLFKQLANMDSIYGVDLKPYLNQLKKAEHIVIYGTGYASGEVIRQLTLYRIEILGFVVSKKETAPLTLYGHHVYEIEELVPYKHNVLILIAANGKYNDEIRELIRKLNFSKYITLNVKI